MFFAVTMKANLGGKLNKGKGVGDGIAHMKCAIHQQNKGRRDRASHIHVCCRLPPSAGGGPHLSVGAHRKGEAFAETNWAARKQKILPCSVLGVGSLKSVSHIRCSPPTLFYCFFDCGVSFFSASRGGAMRLMH
jgi:hypothetical protein